RPPVAARPSYDTQASAPGIHTFCRLATSPSPAWLSPSAASSSGRRPMASPSSPPGLRVTRTSTAPTTGSPPPAPPSPPAPPWPVLVVVVVVVAVVLDALELAWTAVDVTAEVVPAPPAPPAPGPEEDVAPSSSPHAVRVAVAHRP